MPRCYNIGWIVGGFLLLGLCAVSGAQQSRQQEDAAPPTPEQAAFFEKRVRPLLVDNCYSCHADSLQMGGLRLDSRPALLKGGASGTALVPGEPDKSLLVRAVHYDGKVKMPPSGKMKADQITVLEQWVKMGAPWPETPPASSASSSTAPAGSSRWWAFQAVGKPKPPAVKNAAWAASSPVDRFVLAKLEKNGLTPAPQADRRTLIRRAYFDLIGLPPTPEEVAAFAADRSPDAWKKVVDRLLASPHYGERWGRHWLDVARYADSNGLDENKAFAHAFRYRDYVINALNRDKPYDEFVREQLAGDLMPTDDEALRNERLTATGFLTLGAKVLAEQDKPKLVMDIVDEQIEVTSKAFLGLTVSCARCHDHKFDPIPTRDYYALAGIFKSTKTMKDLGFVSNWMERPLESKALAKAREAYATRREAAQAEVKSATDAANAGVVNAIRRDAAKYLLAGWELSRQPGAFSVAELPARPGETRVLVEAEDYARGNGSKNRDTYGAGIGVIHTNTPPTFAEYDITVPAAGPYQVELRYAAMEARPVRLLVNGQVVLDKAAGAVTGSWNPDGQRWELQGVFALNAGKNILRLERDGAIPHFDKVLVASAAPSAQPGASAPRTADEIAKEHGDLYTGVVRRWAQRLRGGENDPIFGVWHRLATGGANTATLAAEAARQAERFAAAEKGTPDLEPLRKALYEPGGLLALPEKPEAFYSDAGKATVQQAGEKLKAVERTAPQVPSVMAVEEGKAENIRIHLRGSTLTLGEEAPRGFLTVLNYKGQPTVPVDISGRLELAQWLTNPKHPLTARVAVNRVWQGHFGEGLVRTPDNWGLRGEKPTHPELLDWLAATFVEQGWSLIKLHRLILLSNTYRMSAAHDPQAFQKDPENRLLWRANRRRLEAEPFRDAVLCVSGKLDQKMGGSLLTTANNDYVTNDQSGNAARYNSLRRSIYLPVIRNALFDYFQAFDFGDPTTVNARRASTTVAPQALYVLNSPFMREQSRAFALDLLSRPLPTDSARVALAYRRALGRSPSTAETNRANAFLSAYAVRMTEKEPDAAKRRERAWQGLCQVLFASNEFIYVD